MRTKYHGDILWAEYIDGVPHSVVTTEGTYDFEHSKRYGGTIFSFSGSGGGRSMTLPRFVRGAAAKASFWAAEGVALKVDVKVRGKWTTRPATKADVRRLGLVRHEMLPADPFEDADHCDSITYCTICDDHMNDSNESLCRHLFWGKDGIAGPGAGGDGESCERTFLAVCRAAGVVRAVRAGLVPFRLGHSQTHALGGLGPSYVPLYRKGRQVCDLARRLDGRPYIHHDGALRPGTGWLLALGKDTKKANAETKRWLDAEIARQDARRASGEKVYMIRDQHWYGGYETDEAHHQARKDGKADHGGIEPHQSDGAWWTNYTGRKFGTRYSWADALVRLLEIRKAGGHEAMIVYVPWKAKKRPASAAA